MKFFAPCLSLMVLLTASSLAHAAESKGAATSAEAGRMSLHEIMMAKVKNGDRIKVSHGTESYGELLEVSTKSFVLNVETAIAFVPMQIPYEGVKSVSKRKSNALTGLLVGSVTGLVLGLLADASSSGNEFDESIEPGTTIALTVLGGGLGAIIGSQVHSFEEIYP